MANQEQEINQQPETTEATDQLAVNTPDLSTTPTEDTPSEAPLVDAAAQSEAPDVEATPSAGETVAVEAQEQPGTIPTDELETNSTNESTDSSVTDEVADEPATPDEILSLIHI